MGISRRKLLMGTGIALLSRPLLASTWPARPIRLVVPFAPGGPGDFVARQIAMPLSRKLGQPVVVENKPGAGGNLGTQTVLDSEADGYSILLNTVGMHAVNPLMFPDLRFQPRRDLAAVGVIATVPNVLVVHPTKLGVSNLADLVRLGRQHPNNLSYATYGAGSSPHIYGALLQKEAGFTAVAVPYKGSAPASSDVMAGNVDFLFDSMTTCIGQIRGGKLKALAITSAARSSLLPDVPTLQESGYPALDLKFWLALQVSAKTPASVLQALREAVAACTQDATYGDALVARGAEPFRMAPASVQDFVNRDAARWTDLARSIGIKPE
ncbi:tripartite tricarboxylate transporter substrate binding protein [Cupriavidus metallidurans]|uniref:Bug family tripartite tricarboxylate transporter substrate binding protein n=1 Tax=Cupriavidus TaxID=106589 RepID=UPI0002A4576A|nr:MULTISPECIES: tripartite tricarboxylate transporter substrate binding protein [Cupriavidus]EKZ98402.1 extra-cytoplasmic solute receptor protein [Cupriavidus sp. HMR-1]GMG91618.1 ABC transporter substrate-binding protein [Cupriavidus sp. TKC]